LVEIYVQLVEGYIADGKIHSASMYEVEEAKADVR